MSPARAHRERHAASGPATPSEPIVSVPEGGQPAPMFVGVDPARLADLGGDSPARRHRLAQVAAAIVDAPASAADIRPQTSEEAQIALRLKHDLRRLHEIKSIEKKIEAKREMLPEYRGWIEGVLAADIGVPAGLAADVVPTMMVWLIDTGDFADVLPLAEFVLRHHVAMPARYNRDAATVLVEEIADAAIKLQAVETRFPIEVLAAIDGMTAGADMHDEVRAKLAKAIGVEQLELANGFDGQAERTVLEAALASLRRAHALHDRIGVKDRIKRVEKLLGTATNPAATAA